MAPSSATILSFLFTAFCLLSSTLCCDPLDRAALLRFSDGIDRGGVLRWSSNSSVDCCSWVGVLCDDSPSNTSRRVVGLNLGSRSLSGKTSDSLSRLDCLRSLNLSQNELSGEILSWVFRISSLQVIDLSQNLFSGPLEDAFNGLGKLEHLSIRSNSFNGSIPKSLSSCSMLRVLDLGSNQLDGRVDLDFTGLGSLQILSFDGNRFVGRIPKSISSCRRLELLSLASNNLHGEIPWGFTHLRSLASLSLGGNRLSNATRALLALGDCQNLTFLDLSGSFNGGEMPDTGIRGFPNLEVLMVRSCSLSGSIPSWLSRSDRLCVLDLSHNRLHGHVPSWLGALKQIFVLALSNNSLSGEIPVELSQSPAFNNPYPRNLQMPVLLYYKGVHMIFQSFIPVVLDLSLNSLNGTQWRQLANLTGLEGLNLSRNGLSGSLPDGFSQINRLEFLDLSYNEISGTIPLSMTNLTSLSVFDVSYNRLEGCVPEEKQFATFDLPSFVGNPQLKFHCTRSHGKVPKVKGGTKRQGTKKQRFTVMGFPYGIGVVLGFFPTVVVCGIRCGWLGRSRKQRMD